VHNNIRGLSEVAGMGCLLRTILIIVVIAIIVVVVLFLRGCLSLAGF